MSVFNTSVLFLGHVLSAEGISANPEKLEKVINWHVPKRQRGPVIFGISLILKAIY